MPNHNAKLTDDEQYQVCKWYAEFRTPTKIKALLAQEYGKDLAIKNVWQYAHGKKWKPMIERLRQEWALGVMDVPLAHKRARLEKLVQFLQRAERLDIDGPSGKDHRHMKGRLPTTEKDRIKLCVEILREMREEMEAGKAEFTNIYLTTIHTYSDEEILKQRDRVLERLKQFGGLHGSRHDRQVTIEASPGATEDALHGGDDGGGLHQRPDGEAHAGDTAQDAPAADHPKDAGQAASTGKVAHAESDGTRPQSDSPQAGI